MTFSRSGRLLKHADFDRVYKNGRRHFSANLTAFYLVRDAGNTLRVGFTVSKALGGAVDRNRMKRRLREAVRMNWPNTIVSADVVINPKKSLLRADFSSIVKEISRAFEIVEHKCEKQSPATRASQGDRPN